MNILVIDCGTTSIRGILFSGQGQRICTRQIRSDLIRQEAFLEQDPDFYTGALTSICREISGQYPVDALSLTAFRSSPTLLDAAGTPMHRFIMWQDERNREICQELAAHDTFVRQTCGAGINTVFTATKLTWLKRSHPELWEKTHKALVVPDFLIHFMTGAYVTDKTYGSRTLLMNLASGQWDDALCRIFSIEPEKLCELIEPGTVAGYLCEEFAAESGLTAGIPVVSAGGDQQCAALGLGVTEAGTLALNLGTGGYVMALSNAPAAGLGGTICNRSALPDRFILETSLSSCAAAFNEYINTFHPEFEGNMKFLDRLVQDGTGAEADRARAFYDGMAEQIARCTREHPGFRDGDEPIYIAGGIANSAVFNQTLARCVGRRLIRWNDPEATAIGAFASAAATLGLFPDVSAAVAQVRSYDGREIFGC